MTLFRNGDKRKNWLTSFSLGLCVSHWDICSSWQSRGTTPPWEDIPHEDSVQVKEAFGNSRGLAKQLPPLQESVHPARELWTTSRRQRGQAGQGVTLLFHSFTIHYHSIQSFQQEWYCYFSSSEPWRVQDVLGTAPWKAWGKKFALLLLLIFFSANYTGCLPGSAQWLRRPGANTTNIHPNISSFLLADPRDQRDDWPVLRRVAAPPPAGAWRRLPRCLCCCPWEPDWRIKQDHRKGRPFIDWCG